MWYKLCMSLTISTKIIVLIYNQFVDIQGLKELLQRIKNMLEYCNIENGMYTSLTIPSSIYNCSLIYTQILITTHVTSKLVDFPFCYNFVVDIIDCRSFIPYMYHIHITHDMTSLIRLVYMFMYMFII